MEVAVTKDVEVRVESFFVQETEHNGKQGYQFAYRVQLKNLGATPVQLISRHWIITDSSGDVKEVRGAGVVGEQPRLGPGESYEYMSGSLLESPVGTMEGTYQMHDHLGESFDVTIPRFQLVVASKMN